MDEPCGRVIQSPRAGQSPLILSGAPCAASDGNANGSRLGWFDIAWLVLALLEFESGSEDRKDSQVLWTTGRLFRRDQLRQGKHLHRVRIDSDRLALRNDLLVPANPTQDAEQIQGFIPDFQREVAPELDGSLIQREGEVRGKAAEARPERRRNSG